MAAFVTPAELEAWTQGKIQKLDPRVQPLLDGASAAIRRYCGWHVSPAQEETLVLDGPGGALLQLPTLRVTDVASVEVAGNALDADDFEWSVTGEVRKICWPGWSNRYRSIKVTFTHGFDVLDDIKQVVLQVCSAALSSPMGATREQAGSVSISWATTAPGVSGGMSLLARDFAVLDKYKLPAVL